MDMRVAISGNRTVPFIIEGHRIMNTTEVGATPERNFRHHRKVGAAQLQEVLHEICGTLEPGQAPGMRSTAARSYIDRSHARVVTSSRLRTRGKMI